MRGADAAGALTAQGTRRVSRRSAVLLLAAAVTLAACGARRRPAGAGSEGARRDPAAPVGAQVDVTEARLAGTWRVVWGRSVPVGASVLFAPGRMSIAGRNLDLKEVGPGRFEAGGRPLWAHWLDADARTLAAGDPEGSWVFVLDRTGAPEERRAPAAEILDWYGYDTEGL